jgi:predicted TIM-barrel fold metal-dependent hydrolase
VTIDVLSAQPVFDIHSHVGLDQAFWMAGWWPYAATAQDLLERMQTNGIDRAVCFPFGVPSAFDAQTFGRSRKLKLQASRVPFDPENRLLVHEVERVDRLGRLLPFAMFDPGRKVPEQLERLEGLIGRIGGLKTQTTVLRSPIRALLDEASDIMAFAAEHDLPVVIHTALLPADDWAQVRDCLAVAETFPNVRFDLAHSLRFHANFLRLAAQMPNIWVDCSAHLIHCRLARDCSPAIASPVDRVEADYSSPASVLEGIFDLIEDRYMWGSDNPFMSWCDDKNSFVCTYEQEVQALRSASSRVVQSMTRGAPAAWLAGEKGR